MQPIDKIAPVDIRGVNFFYTADEHYFHKNVNRYCDRPFLSVNEGNNHMIEQHNCTVGNHEQNVTIHAGDFSFGNNTQTKGVIQRLNGRHIFLMGSHDRWSSGRLPHIFELKVGKQFIVVCHYSMRTWARSHYNSWQLYGHSHGKLPSIGKQHDIGVDSNDFKPLTFGDLKRIMVDKPDNPNLIRN